MAQPSLGVAVQRVDNFGAGWLAAGATAVIAEAHGAPAWYIKTLFQRRGTVESMRRRNPAFHDHVLDFDSVRSPGARLLLDPDRASTGFYRSIVLRPGATTGAALSGARPANRGGGVAAADVVAPAWASPVDLDLADPVVAGSTAALTLSVAAGGTAALPPGLTIGARWDPILVDVVPAGPAATADAPAAAPAAGPADAPAAPSGVPAGVDPRRHRRLRLPPMRRLRPPPQPHRHLRPPPQPHRRPRSVTRRRRGPCRPPRRPRPSLPRSTSSRPRPPARSS